MALEMEILCRRARERPAPDDRSGHRVRIL